MSFIIHPITYKKYNINSYKGNKLLYKYLNQLGGSADDLSENELEKKLEKKLEKWKGFFNILVKDERKNYRILKKITTKINTLTTELNRLKGGIVRISFRMQLDGELYQGVTLREGDMPNILQNIIDSGDIIINEMEINVKFPPTLNNFTKTISSTTGGFSITDLYTNIYRILYDDIIIQISNKNVHGQEHPAESLFLTHGLYNRHTKELTLSIDT